MEKYGLLPGLIILLILFSCNSKPSSKEDGNSLKRLTMQWNTAIENKDSKALGILYADTVSLYGKSMSEREVIENKLQFFRMHTDYKQTIIGEIKLSKLSEHQYKTEFLKHYSFGKKTVDVSSYLIFDKQNEDWEITEESDRVTDGNLTQLKNNLVNHFGESISGDFDGDGRTEKTATKITKEGIFDSTAYEFLVTFSDTKLNEIKIWCDQDYFFLINEGDLNGVSGDEITIYRPPNHGCTYGMKTYTYAKGTWTLLIEPFLVPTACDEMSEEALQKRIFKEGNTIYYYDVDEDFNLVKKKAVLK